MNVGAAEAISQSKMIWDGRMRTLFGGLGYALSFAAILVLTWTVQQLANDFPRLAFSDALREFALALLRDAVALLPTIPLLVAAANRVPRDTSGRFVWLAGAAVVSALWGTVTWLPDARNPTWLSFFIERLLSAGLMAAMCVYHNSMRGAAEALLKEQIENATLDTTLDRARLQLLRSQMEPHFLFNTLANVRALAKSDRVAAAEMLANLARYLAAALPKLRQDMCPLAEELQLIDAYLSIHRVRMGTRLGFAIDMPPDLADMQVPTMMLITLIENALKHGLNPIVEGGFIRVSAARSGDKVLLKVADSGHGIPLGTTHGSGMGLANIHVRLRMQYGEHAQLLLAPAEPRGVVATISIPAAQ